MARTRAAVLAGARICLQRQGVKATTMVDVAATAGVAKATLYNHFRTKAEVLAALVDSELTRAAADTAEAAGPLGLPSALARLAERLGEHPIIRRLATAEPALLAGLVVPAEQSAAGWAAARTAVRELLSPVVDPAGLSAATETVLRWLVSTLLWPVTREEAGWATARLLAPDSPPPSAAAPEAGAGAPEEVLSVAVPECESDELRHEPVPALVTTAVSGPSPDGTGSTVAGLGFPAAPARAAAELVTVLVPSG